MKKTLFISVFFITLATSIVVNLPLSWLLNQPKIQQMVQQNIPKEIELTNPSGSWWQGSLNVSFSENNSQKDAGNVAWKLNWLPLLQGNIAADLAWTLSNQTLLAKVDFDGENLKLTNLTGEMPVSRLMLLSSKTAILADATGDVHFRNLAIDFSLPKNWLTSLSGVLAVTDFSALGANFGLLEIKPAMQGQDVKVNLTGGSKAQGWDLTGNSVLHKNRRFQFNVKVTAQSDENMPDWVAIMIPMKNPKLAELNKTGRW